jgi:hypothetical protein
MLQLIAAAINPRATDLKGIRLCLAIASILGAIAAAEINSTLMFSDNIVLNLCQLLRFTSVQAPPYMRQPLDM